ncbi:acylphosphatase [Chroococcidiopsis sp.]|uniref:acylphosphatase n=1 Tax=Chroococcidiopsis sp. TaxID=3088168 RepID=UPI000B72A7F8|nr:acylphosphatase [cyanobacterium TDX16]
MQDRLRAHVFVSGRVQGVGYRMSTAQMAAEMGLHGWVRNLPDGRVEAVFEGTRELVAEAIAWCRQGNPPAVVKDVAVEYETLEGLRKFEIRR